MTRRAERDQLLTIEEVLEELGVKKSTFYGWKATGRAPKTIKYPNAGVRIRRSELNRWIEAHEEAA